MDAESEREMVRLLTNRFNKWWIGQKIKVPEFKRRDFEYLIKKINDPKALILIGPRQVGKTTVVMQIIDTLLDEGIEPKRVMYVQLDDVELGMLSEKNLLIDILSAYQKNILMEDLNTIEKEVYLFLDEVQRVPDWAEQVKALNATNKKIHILATGSASFNISQKSKETLPGRQELFIMYPLKFADATALHASKFGTKLDIQKIGEMSYKLREKFVEGLNKKSFSEFFEECKTYYMGLAQSQTEISNAVSRYLSKGGYPEIIITEDTAQCQKLLKSYANDVVVKDLMPWYSIRDFPTAEKLMFLLAANSGEQLNINELLKRLIGVNQATVNKYIDYIESLNIILRLPGYSGTKMGSTKHKKVYFCDVGLRNAVLGLLDAPFPDFERGHLAETVAYDHIERLAYKLNEASPGNVTYYLGKGGEVDFVIDLPRYGTKLPIEIKFREKIDDLDGLKEFMEIKKIDMGIVVTEDMLKWDKKILFIPLWMFLTVC